MPTLPTLLVAFPVALVAFGAGWLAGRRASSMTAAMAENADLRRRMDELADALLAADKDTHP